jgi:hypothetical protein
LLSGTFMVDTVRVRAIGIDPAATTEELPYEIELVEGDVLRQSWVDYYRGQNPARGIRWGGLPSDAKLSQAVIEVMLFNQNALVSQAVVETMIQPTTSARLSQSAIEVMVA